MLNGWCFEPDGGYNITKGQCADRRLSRGREPDEAEIDALPVLMRGAALRFLLTRTLRLAQSRSHCAGAAQGSAGIFQEAALPPQGAATRGEYGL